MSKGFAIFMSILFAILGMYFACWHWSSGIGALAFGLAILFFDKIDEKKVKKNLDN